MSLYVDEYLATGDGPGPRPQHPHRPLRLLRRVPLRRRQLGGGRRDRAALLREPVPRARLRAVDRAPDRRRRAGRRSAPTSRAAFAHRDARRVGRASSARPTRASSPVAIGARAGRRRRSSARATCSSTRDHPGARRRSSRSAGCSPGMDRGQPARTRARRDRHRHRRAARATPGYTPTEIAALRARRSGRVSEPMPARRHRGADRRGAVRGDRRVPRRARLHLDDVRVGRERQPAVLGRRRRGRDHRRPDRAADDAVGVVPSAPLGARAAREQALPLQVHFDLKEQLRACPRR